MEIETCGTCGGDGRIANSFGSQTSCPSCRGSGRRVAVEPVFRDVTKTKASHHAGPNRAAVVEKSKWPSTHEGNLLATEVKDSTIVAQDTKDRLIREIIDYEASHGHCTQTFVKKIRKLVRVRA